MIKPDGVQRSLVGNIISRFEARGFRLVAMKTRVPTKAILEAHYSALVAEPFFPAMRDFMMSGPVVSMVWEGTSAVSTGRAMLGATDPLQSAPGTIRGDFCQEMQRNLCHGSDCVANAEKEIQLWFDESELLPFRKCDDDWIHRKQ
jgi:nucleoside-diphosphate kinase